MEDTDVLVTRSRMRQRFAAWVSQIAGREARENVRSTQMQLRSDHETRNHSRGNRLSGSDSSLKIVRISHCNQKSHLSRSCASCSVVVGKGTE